MALFARSIASFERPRVSAWSAAVPEGLGVAGFQGQCSAIAGVRGLPVPVVDVLNPAHRQMRVNELWIERQRLLRGLARPSITVRGRHVTVVGLLCVCPRQARPGGGVAGIALPRPPEVIHRTFEVLPAAPVEEETPLQGEVVGFRIHWPGARHGRRAEQGQLQRLDHLACNVVLHDEDVVERAVIRLRPEVVAVRRLDQLRRDADLVAGLAHAALQDVRDVELLRHFLDVDLLALELEGRGARGNSQIGDLRQQVEQLLRQAVREVFLVLARAHVRERQHRDGLGRCLDRCLRRRRS